MGIATTQRERNSEKIDSKAIKTHKNDVFRHFQILDPTVDPVAPAPVKRDMREFLTRMRVEDVDLKALGFRSGTRDNVLAELASSFRLGRRFPVATGRFSGVPLASAAVP